MLELESLVRVAVAVRIEIGLSHSGLLFHRVVVFRGLLWHSSLVRLEVEARRWVFVFVFGQGMWVEGAPWMG